LAIPRFLAVALLALTLPSGAVADNGFVAPRGEIPLTSPLTGGARAAGMGGVSVAVADDATASLSNPAALARLQRIELSGGLMRTSQTVEGEMFGSDYESELSGTDFTALRFAYPFPTFRGSLVFALSADRLFDFGDDRLARYDGDVQWTEGEVETTDVWRNWEDYVSDGGVTAWSLAGAMDVSPSISLGAAVSYLSGDYNRSFRWRLEDEYHVSESYDDVLMEESYSSDVSGLRGTLGALFYVAEGLSIGAAIDTPVTLTFDGVADDRLTIDGASSDSTIYFSDEITLPFSFRGGLAYSPVDFVVLGADVGYTEWSEIEYVGRITAVEGEELPTRRTLYDGTFDFGVGVEVTVPEWPLRLRGGYTSRPLAYQGLEIEEDRSYFTLGAGILIDTVLAIDVAWLKGGHERSADRFEDLEIGFTEQMDDSALIVEAAYRF
jgi:long-subunit fatty acid transport protein